MVFSKCMSWLSVVLVLVLGVTPCPISARAMNADTEALARWHLNYADYLVDVGKYLEALEYIDSAYEASTHPKSRGHALLAKAMVLGTFLDAPDEAIAVYRSLAREYPEYEGAAIYQTAFLLMQKGRNVEASKFFRDYLQRFPQGKYCYQSEALLKTLSCTPQTNLGSKGKIPLEVDFKHPVLRVALNRKALSLRIQAASLTANGRAQSQSVLVAPDGAGISVNGVSMSGTVAFHGKEYMVVNAGLGEKRIRGYVSVRNINGRLLVLNHVDIEQYLRSVVPSESYASWPMETLKAQATAARTYAYYQKLHRSGQDYDLVDHEGDQMYGGVDKETTRTDRAVNDTAGQLLVYGGKPILSQYTANSGGFTADAGAIFDAPKPYLVAHVDPASRKGKMASWLRRFSASQIEASLMKIGVKTPGLTAIEPAVTGPSGRIVKIRIRHAQGESVLRTRTTLASSHVLKLPEVLMRVDREGDVFVFRGNGHGHGVGYSQWGAAELGKNGLSQRDILAFYYPNTTLERRWR